MSKGLPDGYEEMSHVAQVCTLMEWGIFDDDGFAGIREDAPDDVKAAYKALKAEEDEARKRGEILD